jgi:hypothetical protein
VLPKCNAIRGDWISALRFKRVNQAGIGRSEHAEQGRGYRNDFAIVRVMSDSAPAIFSPNTAESGTRPSGR